MIETTDQNNNFSIQMVHFDSDRITLGVEVIHWNKLMKILGMKDCYRLCGLYDLDSNSTQNPDINTIPDHALNGGPTGLTSLAQTTGPAFPGDFRMIFSEPILTDGRYVYAVSIAPDRIAAVRSVDNSTAANY
jgi:hypothetical protein